MKPVGLEQDNWDYSALILISDPHAGHARHGFMAIEGELAIRITRTRDPSSEFKPHLYFLLLAKASLGLKPGTGNYVLPQWKWTVRLNGKGNDIGRGRELRPMMQRTINIFT